MSKFYEYKTGIIGSQGKDTAFITIGKLLTGQSTYKGGTSEYINYIRIKPFIYFTWFTKKVTGYYL